MTEWKDDESRWQNPSDTVHFLAEDENIRCGEFVENMIDSTTNDMLITSCQKCIWLIVNDAKPLALKEQVPEWIE